MLNKERYKLPDGIVEEPTDKDFYSEVTYKINYANALCSEFSNPAALALIGVRAIGELDRWLQRSTLPRGRAKR
jgi:cytidine deaminase